MKKLIELLWTAWTFIKFHWSMKPTTLTRHQLRRQKCMFEGNRILVIDYISRVSKRIPPMTRKGKPVNHLQLMRTLYYRYDMKGINFYMWKMRNIIKQ